MSIGLRNARIRTYDFLQIDIFLLIQVFADSASFLEFVPSPLNSLTHPLDGLLTHFDFLFLQPTFSINFLSKYITKCNLKTVQLCD